MEQQKKRAVIYARVSSQNDRQDATRQIKDLEKYAIGQDVKIEKIYEEHISGAKKNEERRILQDCLEYCISNSVNYLYLSEISRLGRSTLQVLRSLEKLHEAKVSVFIQNLGIYSLMEDGKVNPIASILITVLATGVQAVLDIASLDVSHFCQHGYQYGSNRVYFPVFHQ